MMHLPFDFRKGQMEDNAMGFTHGIVCRNYSLGPSTTARMRRTPAEEACSF